MSTPSPPSSSPGGQLLVIGAGLPRTGTLSLMTALEMLLKGKCHHGMKMWQHEDELYDIITDNHNDDEKIRKFFKKHDYISTVDIPLCFHYDKAMEVFPDAKIILTVRDSPQRWYNSIKIVQTINTGCPLPYFEMFGRQLPGYLSQIGPRFDLRMSGPKLGSVFYANSSSNREMFIAAFAEDTAVEFYSNWNKQVKATVPKERLLEFNVKEGWEPLCRFLELPIPDVPFPNMNSGGSLEYFVQRNKRRSWLILYEMVTLPLLFSMFVCDKWNVDMGQALTSLFGFVRK